jgi:hypothetical protein
VTKARLLTVAALWVVAAVVWVGGLYFASHRCSSLIDTLPREGMGVRTADHGRCEVYDVDGTVLERYDLDEWDATEIALVLAGVGGGVLVSGFGKRERRAAS